MSAITSLPHDLQLHLLSFLRASDLGAVQMTCRFYAQPNLVHDIVAHQVEHIYESLTLEGKGLFTYQDLRKIELQVIAKVLNSPEPATGFFVSKSWCKTALKWLETQQEEPPTKKLSKKKQRVRERRMSDISPPWPNVNSDLLCEHECLQRCSNGKSARARRRLLDKQAWKILKRLYPDSTQLESAIGECLQCTVEAETYKRAERDRAEQNKLERKRPLANDHVRRFYTRRTGVPASPLPPGRYFVLPRTWCHQWRRYIKTGETRPVSSPDAAELLCDAHRLLLLPPHLEAYMQGTTDQLFGTSEWPQVLQAAGLDDHELALQMAALNQREALDRENQTVVEILTEDEYNALTECWKGPPSFALSMVVPASGGTAQYSIPVCRDCDATGRQCSVSIRSRTRQTKNTKVSPNVEY